MQPTGGQECPPSTVSKNWNEAARPEEKKALNAGRQKVEATHTDALRIRHQGKKIENDAAAHDELRESEIAAEAAQERRKSPESGIPASTREASLVVDADEIAARGAHYRAPFLSQHGLKL